MNIKDIPAISKTEFPTIGRLFDVADANPPSKEFFPIGIEAFDLAMDGGVREGELITVSGQTGQGKTLFLANLTKNFNDVDVPTLWFTYEMQPHYLRQKMLEMGVTELLNTYVPLPDITSKVENVSELVFVERRIKEAMSDYAVKIIFIDHLHYLFPMGDVNNTSFVVGGIMRELKSMALRNNCIIFLIAHTKKIYQDEELNLSSIRDSSFVVQESDYVYLIERLKKKQSKNDINSERVEGTQWTNESMISLAKNRRTGNMFFKKFAMENNIFKQL